MSEKLPAPLANRSKMTSVLAARFPSGPRNVASMTELEFRWR